MRNGDADRRGLLNDWWALLALLFVFFTGLPAIFAIPAERLLFNPAPYKQALAEQNAYQQFPLLLGQMLAEGGNVFLFGSGSRLLEIMQNSNYEAFVRQVFPQDWVQAQADGLIDQFFAFLNFQSPTFQLIVDLRPIKARLTGPDSPVIGASIMQQLPPCSGQDLLAFGQSLLNGSVDKLPLCQPPPQLQGLSNLVMEGVLKGMAAAMPEQLDLAAVLKLPLAVGGRPLSTAWRWGFGAYRGLRALDPWFPWIALLALLLTGIIAWRTWRGPLYWLGWALVLPGITALVMALVLGLFSSQLAPLLVSQLFGSNLVVFDLLVNMIGRVMLRFTIAAGIIALVAAGVGGLLLLAAFLVQRSEKRVGARL